jgi:molecular chaperone DnaK
VAGLKKAMEGTDPEAIESSIQTLTTASHKLAEEMYKKASASTANGSGTDAGGGTGAGETKTDEKVVDAEFEEVDKDRK